MPATCLLEQQQLKQAPAVHKLCISSVQCAKEAQVQALSCIMNRELLWREPMA